MTKVFSVLVASMMFASAAMAAGHGGAMSDADKKKMEEACKADVSKMDAKLKADCEKMKAAKK
jgi:hypothetical protein